MVLVAACGGGSGGGLSSAAISAEDAEVICTADCEHEAACGDTQGIALCTESCMDDMVGWARGDAVQEVFECRNALACDESDDACVLLVEPLAIHREWETTCRAQLPSCFTTTAELDAFCQVDPPTPGQTGDVGLWRIIAPEVMEDLIGCLVGTDCQTQDDCIAAQFEIHGINL